MTAKPAARVELIRLHSGIFLSLLDSEIGGFFQVSPSGSNHSAKQFYWPDTNILVTRFLSEAGVAQVIDFMPVKGTMKEWRNGIIRIVEGVRGDMEMRLQCHPAFDYARESHRTSVVKIHSPSEPLVMFQSSNLTLALITTAEPECKDLCLAQRGAGVEIVFTISESRKISFELCECESDAFGCLDTESETSFDGGLRSPPLDPSKPVPVEEAGKLLQSHTRAQCLSEIFKNNVKYWRTWVEQCTYRGLWQEKVLRSALALKLLTYEKTGAILAALTFGLPEVLGGERNWDYRYTWVRGTHLFVVQQEKESDGLLKFVDASFTLYALLRVGFKDEALRFMDFIEARIRETPSNSETGPIQIMYGIRGERELRETALNHLRGHAGSRPVWVGNCPILELTQGLSAKGTD